MIDLLLHILNANDADAKFNGPTSMSLTINKTSMQKALQKIIHDSKCLHSSPMGIMVTEFFEKRLKALSDEWVPEPPPLSFEWMDRQDGYSSLHKLLSSDPNAVKALRDLMYHYRNGPEYPPLPTFK